MVNVISRRTTAGAGFAGALLVVLTLASSAHAVTYFACVKKKGGAIRVVTRTAKCKRTEKRISFNSPGVPGSNGANGRNGVNGRNGLSGTNGTNGTDGATGFTATLPKGATEEGTWGAEIPTAKTGALSPISFSIPLTTAPKVNIIDKGKPSTAACPGKASAPAATSGNLCIYASTNDNTTIVVIDPSIEGGGLNEAGPWGTIVDPFTEVTFPGVAYGTWAVTG